MKPFKREFKFFDGRIHCEMLGCEDSMHHLAVGSGRKIFERKMAREDAMNLVTCILYS